MNLKIKACFVLSVAIATICLPAAQASDLATSDSPFSAFSRGIEDRKTHQTLKLAALTHESAGGDSQRTRYQFVLIDGNAVTPIGPVMEGYPWDRIKTEITAKYGKMPEAERPYVPRIIEIPGFGLLIAWVSITDGDLGPHFGQMKAWERIIAFPVGLGMFAVGIPVGGAIDLFTLGTREPPAAFYAIKNGNLVRAFLNVMDFSLEGKKPAKVGHRAFRRFVGIANGSAKDAVMVDLGAIASPDGFQSVVWFGTGDPRSAALSAQLHCPEGDGDGMLYVTGDQREYRVSDCRLNVSDMGKHENSGGKNAGVVLDQDSRKVVRFIYSH